MIKIQTFLPYESFEKSAKCLDYKRLGKQRLEARDILYINIRKEGKDLRKIFKKSVAQAEYLYKRYYNHPCVKLWFGCNWQLAQYLINIIEEWIKRGYVDNQLNIMINVIKYLNPDRNLLPYLIGNKKFHDSHKSNLLRKNYEFYKKYNWKVKNDLPYVWVY